MDTAETVRASIVAKLGFFPPFFEPALATPAILEELWRQTCVAYLDSPLPMIFKEKLAALLGRYCSVPYCLVCHSASLRPMGMTASEVLHLLETPPADLDDLDTVMAELDRTPATQWPAPGSAAETAILNCSIAIFLKENSGQCHENLRRFLGQQRYDFVILFIAYNRVCLSWAEAHPELSHEADERSIRNLGPMISDEPALVEFFANYQVRARAQSDRRTRWLTQENKRLVDEERRLRMIAEEDRSQKRALLDSVDEGIYGVDLAGKCIFSNPAAKRMLRHPEETLVGQDMAPEFIRDAEVDHPDLVWHHVAAFRSIKTGQPQHEPDVILKRYDGSAFAAEVKSVPTKVGGACTGAVVTFRDITDWKISQAEQDQEQVLAKKQHARLRDVFYQTPAPICILEGAEHIYTLVNLPYHDLTHGRELLGKTVREAFPELADSDIHERLDDVFHTGRPYTAMEQLFAFSHDGRTVERYLNFTYQPLYGADNKIEGILVVVHDVTSQVKARQEAERNEARFRLITEAMPQLVWATDASGQCNFLNRRYEQFVGKRSDDLIGSVWRNLIHPEDRASMDQRWDGALQKGDNYQAEYRLQRQDSSYRWMLARGVALRGSDGSVSQWLGTCTDIEEQRMLLDALGRERDMRDRFVAAMTHDLRSPLTAIKMRAELCLRNAATLDTYRVAIPKIISQVNRADGMIQDLLDACSLQFGANLPIHPADCDLTEIVRATVADLADVHGKRAVMRMPPAPVRGHWDARALRRAVENLLTNAVKYGATERPIQISITREGDTVALSVHNEGGVISKAEQALIFDPFQRTQSAKKSVQKGWGLGLPLVRGVAEAHGGIAEVFSDESAGTTFTISLPAQN